MNQKKKEKVCEREGGWEREEMKEKVGKKKEDGESGWETRKKEEVEYERE